MNLFFKKILYGGGIIFDLCKWIILIGIIASLLHTFLITIFIVDGLSMEPTFKDKEFVLLNKRFYSDHNPKRGEVVVVKYPGDPEKRKYVKRVVGLPGDELLISSGKVFINDEPLEEKYISYGVESEPDGAWKLKENEYFLMGDNRPFSNDSRYFGPVEKRFFVGKAISIIYPRYRDDFSGEN